MREEGRGPARLRHREVPALTLGLDVGYRLSPRGESYLNHLRAR
jgi:hypothetical protein